MAAKMVAEKPFVEPVGLRIIRNDAMKKKLLLILSSLAFAFLFSAFCLIRSTGVANNGQTNCCTGFVRWWHPSTHPVQILIDETGSPQAPGALTHEAIRASMNTWNQVRSSYFRFADGGLTNQTSVSGTDRKNVVLFDRDGKIFEQLGFPANTNVLAVSQTFTVTDNLGYRAVDSDLVYNSKAWRFEVNPSSNSFDIQSIATHELGHHLGLDHAGGGRDLSNANTGCGPVVFSATMFFATPAGNTGLRTLELDDVAGVTALYPKWTIAGAVFDNRTGQPFLNANVQLEGTRSPLDTILVNSINTGQTGFFTLPVLDSIATVSVCQPGFISNSVVVQFSTQEIKQVLLGLDPLPEGGISGRILDQTNSTGIEAEIILYAQGKELQRVTSGPDGRYSIPRIPASNPPCTGYDSLEVRPLLNYPPSVLKTVQVNAGTPTELNFQLRPADVVIIDDDGGRSDEANFLTALSRLNLTHFKWDVMARGTPAPVIEKFRSRHLFWITSGTTAPALGQAELQQLTDFLNGGNNLFLSGARLGRQIAQSDFFRNVLHARLNNPTSERFVKGIAGDPVGNELLLGLLDIGEKDAVTTDGNPNAAVAMFFTKSLNDTVGGAAIRYAGSYKAVYFSFDFSTLLDGNPNFSSSDKVLGRVLDWFGLRTGVETRQFPAADMPQEFQLFPNYPNPLRQFGGAPATVIKYTVGGSLQRGTRLTNVQLSVYDLLGRRLITLVDEPKAPGQHSVTWNGKTETGLFVGAGVYFYELRVGETRLTKKMIVLE
jgi:hypothetical protein